MDGGRWGDARSLLEKALEGSLAEPSLASLCALLGKVLTLMGEYDIADAHWSRAAFHYANVGNAAEALRCQVDCMGTRFLRTETRLDNLLEDARRVREECCDLGLPSLAARAMDLEVRILDALQRVDDVSGLAAEALLKAKLYSPPTSLRFLSVAMIEAIYGAPGRAASVAEEAFSQAAYIGDPEAALEALNWWVIALYHQAKLNLPENRALAARAVDIASHSRSVEQRFRLHANLGVWFTDSGDYAAAERALDRAAQVLGTLRAPHLRRNLLLNRGQLALEIEDFSAAREHFADALRIATMAGEPARCVATAGFGLSMLQLGNVREARAALSELPGLPGRWTYDPLLLLTLRARLLALDGRLSLVDSELRRQEANLESTDKTAWMRVRLLRLGTLRRWGRELDQREVELLQVFLAERDIGLRVTELERVTSKRGRSLYDVAASCVNPLTAEVESGASMRGKRSRSSTYS
jgi:tetratricopeptide (TPR) repeat protein